MSYLHVQVPSMTFSCQKIIFEMNTQVSFRIPVAYTLTRIKCFNVVQYGEKQVCLNHFTL